MLSAENMTQDDSIQCLNGDPRFDSAQIGLTVYDCSLL